MTKAKPGDALAVHAHGRTEQVQKRLRAAMNTIEQEIERNDGVYPFHGGRLSLSEVCRRASVHKVTLQGPSHRDSSKIEVENWIKSLKARLITGRKSVRRTVTARADDWESRYKAVANKFNEMYAIEVIAKNKTIRELTAKVDALEDENLMLRSELSSGKVMRLSHAKEKDKPDAKNATPHLVLMRGVPGSGKSTRAARLKEDQAYEHFEADMYFMRNGKYVFDKNTLPAAHDWCLAKTREALQAGRSVVVANVFETHEDVRPYALLGYPWEIVDATGRWLSSHGVPPDKIEALRASWIPKEQIIRGLSQVVPGSRHRPKK